MTQHGAPRRVPEPPDAATAADDGLRRRRDTAPRAHTRRVGAHTVVELYGEIDIVGVESVGGHLDAATGVLASAVVIDLRPTTFFDCSGVRLLCRAHRRVRERGGRLRLVCDNALILRALRAGGLMDVLRPLPTLDEALREKKEK